MKDVRQSPFYAKFIESLDWKIEKVGEWNVFIKKFPLIGSLIKFQRILPPIDWKQLEKIARDYKAFEIVIEPLIEIEKEKIPKGYKYYKKPFLPTKTLILDLEPSLGEIFNSFSKSKRRDIRLAEKKGVKIEEGTNTDFLKLKEAFLLKKGILPIGTKKEILSLGNAFGENMRILIGKKGGELLAGIIVLFYDQQAYYWQAASTPKGKNLLVPTLLLWEAIKRAKQKRIKFFDFEGIFDERFPLNKSWLGFSNFKKGFGGKERKFGLPIFKRFWF